jgi:hypothetical protein
MYIARNTNGRFNQTGGSMSASSLTIGTSTGNSRVSGIYTISGGSLSLDSSLTRGSTQGMGTVQQTGGQVMVGTTLTIGTGGHGGPPLGIYQISAGTLSAGNITAGGMYATGTFEVFGSDANINAGGLSLASNTGGALGQLFSHVEADGLSTIWITGTASLRGTWEVFDDGAPLGQWNVLTAASGISAPATVVLPDTNWSWGIDNGNTLWAQHVPEPSSLILVSVVALGLLVRVWQRRRH